LLLLFLPGCKRRETAPAQPTTAPAAAFPALPKPAEPLAKNASCITAQCHAKFQSAAHIHGPVSVGGCFSCHAEDQGGHKYPLLRTGNAICTFCHNVAGTKSHQHAALKETAAATTPTTISSMMRPGTPAAGGCMGCHDPHVSRAKFLLTADNVDALCAKCHDVPLKKFAHQPFAAGQCTVCHQPHESDYANLQRYGNGPDHCYGCHKDKQVAMKEMPHKHEAAMTACTTCHGPHATDYKGQLKKPVNDTCLGCHRAVKTELANAKQVHGAVTEGNCGSCHDAHASQNKDILKARTDKVCMTCHEKAVVARDGRTLAAMGPVLASKNLHGPVKDGNCSGCHKPHAADQPNLLKKFYPDTFYAKFDLQNYALCFSCHDQNMVLKEKSTLTNFRDGDRNLHFVHVNRDEKGRSCRTCHEVHGSDLPKHMAATVPFEGSKWAMPMNYEPSATGGSCTPGCHGEQTYNRTKAPPAQGAQP
jgi:predicted CXXCH cytochrome family protein